MLRSDMFENVIVGADSLQAGRDALGLAIATGFVARAAHARLR